MRSDNTPRRTSGVVVTALAGLLAVALIAACTTTRTTPAPSPEATASGLAAGSITKGSTKVVRGYNNPSPCNASVIGTGNDPSVGPNQDLTDLSISCSDKDGVTVAQLRAPLPNPHLCYATLSMLRRARRDVAVVRDPTPTNPYHCLLMTITPNQFVSRAKWLH